MSLKDGDPSAGTDHHGILQKVSPLVSDMSIISLKDSAEVGATDHHRKVEKFSPSVFELSINLFKGRISVSGNRLSSQSRNSFSFGSRPVPKFP